MIHNLPMVSNLSVGAFAQKSSASIGSSSMFQDALKKVDMQTKKSGELKERYTLGDPNVGLTEVMIESQKSKVALTAALEVRNKLLESYRDITNMPV